MKLNKTQIQAIADKAIRDMRVALAEKREKARASYVPSDEYNRVKAIIDERNALDERRDELAKEMREIRDKHGFNGWDDNMLLKLIMYEELNIPNLDEYRTREDLITDLTIKTIDSSFDPYKFIEETINNYLNS